MDIEQEIEKVKMEMLELRQDFIETRASRLIMENEMRHMSTNYENHLKEQNTISKEIFDRINSLDGKVSDSEGYSRATKFWIQLLVTMVAGMGGVILFIQAVTV